MSKQENLPAIVKADASNLYRTLALASQDSDVWQSGLQWYANAHVDGIRLAGALNEQGIFVALEKICEVIAVISPSRYWHKNVVDAQHTIVAWAKFAEQGQRKAYCGTKGVGVPYGWANFIKAWAILDGSATLDFDGSPKTFSFAHNLLYPHDSRYVTIDQHMARILAGEPYSSARGNLRISKRQYKQFADVTVSVADSMGLLPLQAQAIAWEYRQRNVSKAD
jgi:hypothetical protein